MWRGTAAKVPQLGARAARQHLDEYGDAFFPSHECLLWNTPTRTS